MSSSLKSESLGAADPLSHELLFEKIFDAFPDAILVARQDGRIARINAQAQKLFGYKSTELENRPVELLVPERLRSPHVVHRENYLATSEMRSTGCGLNLSARRKDGSEFPADIMLHPLQIDGQSLVLVVLRDIAEHKRIEDALRDKEQRLQMLVDGMKDYAIYMLDASGRVMMSQQSDKFLL